MPEHDAHQKRFQQHGLIVLASKLCVGLGRLPVRHATKVEAHNVSDSGWILASGNESPECADDPDNFVMVPLDSMVATDDSLTILYEQPVGTELTRKTPEEPWRWTIDNKVVDEDGRVIATL